MEIIIDTREKKPWNFENHHQIFKKLETGDYSVEGLEDQIAIERKSLNDYIRSILQDKIRFTKVLNKLSGIKHSCIIVEEPYQHVWDRNYYSKVNPQYINSRTKTIKNTFSIPVFFSKNRGRAKEIALTWLEKSANA